MKKIEKTGMGCLFAILILLLIFGPMILFSSLNPSVKLDQVKSGEIEIGMYIYDFTSENLINNYYEIFKSSNILGLQNVNRQGPAWDKFKRVPIIQNSDSKQFQTFYITSYPDYNWDISGPSKVDLTNAILSAQLSDDFKVRF